MLSVNIQKELWQEWLKADINQIIKHHKKMKKAIIYPCAMLITLTEAIMDWIPL